jgi:hypothetical protein
MDNKDRKSTTIQIRLTAKEKDGMLQASKIAGISLSAWIRERLRIATIRELEGAGIAAPFVDMISIE